MGGSSEPKPQVSSGSSKSNQKVTMPDWADREWRDSVRGYSGIADEFGNVPTQTQMGWDLAEDVAMGRDPFNAFQTSMTGMTDTAGGGFLHGGQGFNEAVEAAFRAGMPNVLSAFQMGGRSGGGLAQVAAHQVYADAQSGLFNQERDRMFKAQQLLPGMSLMPAATMEGIGQGMDARQLQQAQLYAGVPAMLSPLRGSQGTQTSESTVMPAYMPGNPVQDAIGLGIAGAGALSGLGPLGSLVGAGAAFAA